MGLGKNMDKEKLSTFYFPMPRVLVPHMAEGLSEIMTEYWKWNGGRWHHYNDWYTDPNPEATAQWREPITKENPATTRGCESEYAWKCLYKAAILFGYDT
jgi:hypothetical protein